MARTRHGDSDQARLREVVARALRRTLAGMWAERLARAFWPLWSLIALTGGALALGLHRVLSDGAMAWGGLILGLAVLAALAAGLWRLRPPRRGEALYRLDRSLPGRPLGALADRPAAEALDAFQQAVWERHIARMAAAARAARPVPPDLRLAARDPFALRYAALLVLTLGVVFGAPTRMGEVARLAGDLGRAGGAAAAHGPSWEGWVEPPAHTGRPSLYLNEVSQSRLSLPQGSEVTLRLYGAADVLGVDESVSGGERPAPGGGGATRSHDFTVAQSGRIAVRGPSGRSWEIVAEPDTPPRVSLDGGPEREGGGQMRQAFEAQDDYGVVGGTARITLDLAAVDRRHGLAAEPEPRDPIELDLPLPISGDRSDFADALVEDLSRHPWANLPVRLRLSAQDATGQTGRSEEIAATLPGRRFFDPLAGAVAELRRDILWTAQNAPRVARVLRALIHRPDGDLIRQAGVYLQLRAVIGEIKAGLEGDALPPARRDRVAAAMWDIALQIEEGDMADAAERLRRARERLSQAMRNGADPSEIEELMDELRAATEAYIRQLAEQGGGDDDGGQEPQGERMEITGAQLQELMDRIEELMAQGRMAEAAELMARLNQLMDNLQVSRGEGGEGAPGGEGMDGLGETLQGQQDLADETFRELQERFDEGTGQEEGRRPGEQDGVGEDGTADGNLEERQRALRDRLRESRRDGLPGGGTESGEAGREALDRAERSMNE
ncbi:ATPase, partial [Rhodobacteraceae bacterium WD3A24]